MGAGQLQKVYNETVELSYAFGLCQAMLTSEMMLRVQRADEWDRELKDRSRGDSSDSSSDSEDSFDPQYYQDLKDRCDKDEMTGLPADFATLWNVVQACKDSKRTYDNEARKLGYESSWPCLNGEFTIPDEIPVQDYQDKWCLRELYNDCRDQEEGFKSACKRLAHKMNLAIKFKPAKTKMKGVVRAMYKFTYKYKRDARQLTDLLRASFVFHDLDSLRKGALVIHKEFPGGILRMKDRFYNPSPSGNRDVLLNVEFKGIVVEIQLHLKTFYDLKKEGMHAVYKKARHFGNTFDKICYA